MLLDTHEAIKVLIKEGFKEKQAEAITNIINKRDNTLATKEDISSLRNELKKDIDLVKKDIEHIKERMATKADIKDLKIDMANLNNELGLIKKDFLWMKVLLVGVMGLLVKIAFFKVGI
jgi:seryl-tRNA synthetase